MPVDPKTRAFLDTLQGAPPISTLSPADARAVLHAVQGGILPSPPAVVQELTLPLGPTGSVDVRIVRPPGPRQRLPVVLYLHGGGWILGDVHTHDHLVRELATGAGVAVAFVEYARSPEARWPVAIEQTLAVADYLVAHADALGIDGARMAIAADSAGGQIAAVAAMLARERGGPSFALQVLFYPVTDAGMDTPSYAEFADGPWLTRASMAWFWDAYVPDPSERVQPTVSPLRAPTARLVGMPPTLVMTAENDVLRDEGEAYAARLADAGVLVTSVRYNGAIHDFVMLNPIRLSPACRAAIDQACTALRAAFANVEAPRARALAENADEPDSARGRGRRPARGRADREGP